MDPQQAPDLLAAGAGQPAQDTPSLVDALRSRGSLPAELLPMLLSGGGQTSPYAAALSAGVSAMRGTPDPVAQMNAQGAQQRMQMGQFLNQMQREANADSRQRRQDALAEARYQETVRKDKAAEERANQAATDKILDHLITSGDPEAVALGWTQRARRLPFDLPPEMVQRLSRGKLDMETLKGAAALSAAGATEEEITGVFGHKGITPEHLPLITKMGKDPNMLKAMGMDPHEADRWAMTVEDHKLKLDANRLANLRADADMEMKQRSMQHQETMESLAVRRADQADRRADQADRNHADLMKRLADKVDTKEQKRQGTFAALEDALFTARWRAGNLDKKGYLPKGAAGPVGGLLTGDPSAAKAEWNRTMFPNDTDWRAWQQLNAAVVGIDRVALNEIGPRARQFFEKQLQLFDKPPSLDAINQSINQFESFLRDAKAGKVPDVQEVTIQMPNGKKQVGTWRRGEPFDLPTGAVILDVK